MQRSCSTGAARWWTIKTWYNSVMRTLEESLTYVSPILLLKKKRIFTALTCLAPVADTRFESWCEISEFGCNFCSNIVGVSQRDLPLGVCVPELYYVAADGEDTLNFFLKISTRSLLQIHKSSSVFGTYNHDDDQSPTGTANKYETAKKAQYIKIICLDAKFCK